MRDLDDPSSPPARRPGARVVRDRHDLSRGTDNQSPSRPVHRGPLASLLAVLSLSPGTGACNRPAAEEAPVASPPTVAAPAAVALPAPVAPERVRGRKLLAEATSPFSKIRVQQQGTKRTLGFVRKRGDEWVQTIIDLTDPDVPAHAYAEAMAAPFMVVDAPRRLLVVGLGGGTLVRWFHSRLPAAHIDAVEIDPEVVRLAAEWFGVVPGPRLGIFTDDAVRFIAGEGPTYDIIWLDAFLDPGAPGTDNAGVPEELRGLGFLRRVKQRLSPGGAAAFNIHHLTGYDVHVNAIAEVFPQVHVVRRPGSNEWIVLALAQDEPLAPEDLQRRAAALDATKAWGISFAELAAVTTPWQRRPAP
ncbi:spermidine synthase [Nannocystis bainbridge]|uniref:Fused MFS/spermidine synthase n=1 Tax=Nannocystis bainbridge TaxID=2995303 RepID=A0ABT5EEA1_9BACT|nr:fused MFS/spermidine synthase [Nannocystis bainbridge]MDC0723152.1 fused MFS/spermidine synthase [Nannocystis bainbridge]